MTKLQLTDFLEERVPWIETAQPVPDVGDATKRLARLPADQRCDLVAVGTHGRTGIRRALLGSVAESPTPIVTSSSHDTRVLPLRT